MCICISVLLHVFIEFTVKKNILRPDGHWSNLLVTSNIPGKFGSCKCAFPSTCVNMGRYEFGVVKGGVWETLFVIYVCKREVGGSPFNSVYVFHLALDWPHPPPLTSGRSVGVAYGRIFFF